MKLIINKFPPIMERCEIDLSKKVTLFVGKNNSGKTYLSQLIRGVFDHINYREMQKYIDIDLIPKDFDEEFVLKLDEKLLAKISKVFTTYMIRHKINYIFKKEMKVDFTVSLDMEEVEINTFREHMSLQKTYKIDVKPINEKQFL